MEAVAELNQGITTEQRGTAQRTPGFRKLLGVSGITMALLLPIGIYPRVLQNQELDSTHDKIVEQVPAVSVTNLVAAPPSRKLSLPGSVEALVETPIFARSSGYIRDRYVDIGDRVSAGQLLADIETPELDEGVKETKALVLTNVANRAQTQANLDKARADLTTAEADLSQAKANLIQYQTNEKFAYTSYVRWNNLVKQGAVSSQDADEKDTIFKADKAATTAGEERVRSAESQVAAAKTRVTAELASIKMSDANIDAARARQNISSTQQNFNKVAAPFTGIITERNIDQGTLITSGSQTSNTVLYRLARIDTVKVFVDVPQYASSAVKVGQQVSVTLKEFPGKTFVGKIERTSVALDSNARTLKTEIHIPNSDLRLVPGMYADVNFSVPRPAHTFLIPANALMTRAEGPQVLIASGDSVRYRNVQIGDDLGKQVEVVSGLLGSETVVVNPKDSLHDGTKVTVEKQ
jgi:RND family efflux transporter MFP subunit